MHQQIVVPMDRMEGLSQKVNETSDYLEKLVRRLRGEIESLGALSSTAQLQESQQRVDQLGHKLIELMVGAGSTLKNGCVKPAEADEYAAQAAAALGQALQRVSAALQQFPVIARNAELKKAVRGSIAKTTGVVSPALVPHANVPTTVQGAVPVMPPGMVPAGSLPPGTPVAMPAGTQMPGVPGQPAVDPHAAMHVPAGAAPGQHLDAVEAVLAVASMELGTMEVGGNNRGSKVEAYQKTVGIAPGNPWCAAFVNWCMVHAGISQWPATGDTWAIRDWANTHGVYVTTPQRGDVFNLLDGHGDPRHTGIVTAVNLDGTVSTIEGNTGGGPNGADGVFQKTQSISECKFVRWSTVLSLSHGMA